MGGGVINLFDSYPGIGKNIWRDAGGERGASGVIKIWGLKLKCTQPLPSPPTHLMIKDSPLKERFYSFRDEIGQPRSFSAAGIAYTLAVSTVKMGVYIQWKLRQYCSSGIGMIRFYKVTFQSALFCRHYTLVYREQQPAGLQQRRNGGCVLIVVFFWSPLCSVCLFLFFSVQMTAQHMKFSETIN